MTTNEIRRLYLEFFKSKKHEIVRSYSLVPEDDPTLLFTGAGMNQFKEKFLGRNITYRRAASSQKCLRTGDLENVGKTAGHHTFFEMLGNFSFGDYFKKDAILWGWEFLTKALKIPEGKLWVSVYKDDDEAYAIWRDIVKIPEERIVSLDEKDNFWPSEAPSKGPNGPCGPCSEMFYDWGGEYGCGRADCSPACDCKRFSEIWNLVFTQFDRQQDGTLKPLPNKNIDTGMGLERIASVMQGVRTNFETDIFKPIVREIENASSCIVNSELCIVKQNKREPRTTNHESRINAIADHVRAAAFAICDGVMPSNEERGYVVRKLIRRSAAYAVEIGIDKPFLYELVAVVAEVMKAQYPELVERRDDIASVVKREEESFRFVLDTQLPKAREAFSIVRDSKSAALAAFILYDTYGMPLEMLKEIARERGIEIVEEDFENLLEEQRSKSRAKTKIKGEIFSDTFAKRVEALGLKTDFLGYEKARSTAKVLEVMPGGEIILDKTPFYGESGGQAGDWGTIETDTGKMEVEDAKKIGGVIVHIGKMLNGRVEKGQSVKVSIDEDVRRRVMRNHTATHLLQAALREVLGAHVHQTGSLVDDKHLRFDFTHMKKMAPREVKRVEEIVNENIKKHIKVTKEIKDLDAAKKDGATALFGEKYESKVRVVTIGDVSKELCGGTHLGNTKDIEIFKITSEGSIASGTRRIEALTGEEARAWMKKQDEVEAAKLKSQAEKDKEVSALELRLSDEMRKIDAFISRARVIGKVKFVCESIAGLNMEGLRSLADGIKSREKDSLVILSTETGGKAHFIVALGEGFAAMKKVDAGDVAKMLAKEIDGSGGGKPNFAQGGGKNAGKLESGLKSIIVYLKEKLI